MKGFSTVLSGMESRLPVASPAWCYIQHVAMTTGGLASCSVAYETPELPSDGLLRIFKRVLIDSFLFFSLAKRKLIEK